MHDIEDRSECAGRVEITVHRINEVLMKLLHLFSTDGMLRISPLFLTHIDEHERIDDLPARFLRFLHSLPGEFEIRAIVHREQVEAEIEGIVALRNHVRNSYQIAKTL